jgi:hypothetical protein
MDSEKMGDFLTFDELDPQDKLFDAANKRLTPNGSVRQERHEDGLKGRPVEVLVHPLVQRVGHYVEDKSEITRMKHVWMPAEVWVDSTVSS